MLEQNGYAVDYGDAYMEQEEEWEREGLLDPAWEKQQKKVSISIVYFFSEFYNVCDSCDINPKKVNWFEQEKQRKFFLFDRNACVSVDYSWIFG